VSGAAAGVLTALFGPDYHFTVSSESLPGVTRSFDSFDAAAQEAGRSRIYGGIHYQFDNVNGLGLGAQVADYVMAGFLQPRDDEGDSLRAAAVAPTPANDSLRPNSVQPLLAEALPRWQPAGADTSALDDIDVRIGGLGGLTLGKASGNVLWLDDNAAGDEARMGLLPVLEHEIGQLLGRGQEADAVMQERLTAGSRRTVSPVPTMEMIGPGVDVTGFESDEETP
jgi:hypothetical protein